jgi:hypothetical protein
LAFADFFLLDFLAGMVLAPQMMGAQKLPRDQCSSGHPNAGGT